MKRLSASLRRAPVSLTPPSPQVANTAISNMANSNAMSSFWPYMRTLSLSGGHLLAKGLAFVVAIALARTMGAAVYGRYVTITTYLLFFSAIADLGLVMLVAREVGRVPASAARYLTAALVAQVILICAVAVGVWAGARLIVPAGDVEMAAGVGLALVALIIDSLGRPFSAILLGREQTHMAAAAIVAGSMVNSAGLASVMILSASGIRASLLLFVAVGILSALASSGTAFWLCMRYVIHPLRQLDLSMVRSLVIQATPFALVAGFGLLYNRVDILLLERLSGAAVAGQYAAAGRLIEGALVLPTNLAVALLPRMARRATSDTLSERIGIVFMALAVLFMTVGAVEGPRLSALVYGPNFVATGVALRPLMLALGITCLILPLSYQLQATNRMRPLILLNALFLLINAGANLMVIPRWGSLGAADVTLLCAVGFPAALLPYVHSTPLFLTLKRTSLRTLPFGIVLTLICCCLHQTPLGIALPGEITLFCVGAYLCYRS